MGRITLERIAIDADVTIRALRYRAKARKLGRKQGKTWTFDSAEAGRLLEPGVRGNPNLRRKGGALKSANLNSEEL